MLVFDLSLYVCILDCARHMAIPVVLYMHQFVTGDRKLIYFLNFQGSGLKGWTLNKLIDPTFKKNVNLKDFSTYELYCEFRIWWPK